jgi:hypothetical protein
MYVQYWRGWSTRRSGPTNESGTPAELVRDVLTLASVFADRLYEHGTTGLRKRVATVRKRMCTD